MTGSDETPRIRQTQSDRWRSPSDFLKRIALLIACLLMTTQLGCASNAGEVRQDATEPVSSAQPTAVAPPFVVVDLTTQFYLAPDHEAPFFQYRTPDEQAEVTDRLRESTLELNEKLKARFEKEIEREKKRMKRMRKAEDRVDYAEGRRLRRAKRYLKSIRSRAKGNRELAPNSRFVVLKLIEREGTWLKVETLPGDHQAQHCYSGGLPNIDRFRLDLWIEESALRDVTTKKVRTGLWRGSEVILAPGVVVEKRGGAYHALVDGYRIELELDPKAVGTSFESPTQFPRPVTDTRFSTIALAEGKLRLNRTRSLPYNPHWELYVTGTMWVGNRFYATTQTPCGEYTVHADEDDLEIGVSRGTTRISGVPPEVTYPKIPAQTQIWNPTGEELGIVVNPISLPEIDSEPNSLVCFRTPVWDQSSKDSDVNERRSLEWCVERSSIQESENED